MRRRILGSVTALILLLSVAAPFITVNAAEKSIYSGMLRVAGNGLLERNPEPSVGSVGGEWVIIALARGGIDVPNSYYDEYAKKAEEYLKNGGARRYTDYSRIMLAMSAVGLDTSAAEKYLSDYDAVTAQGINGAVYALLALNSRACGRETAERYLSLILERQHSDGGFGLSDTSDADVTAMTLQALAEYMDRKNVKTAVERATQYLDDAEITSLESAAQATVAMCALNREPYKYAEQLLDYYAEGQFSHTMGGALDAMATEQGVLALAALNRYENGKSALYDMGGTIIADVAEDKSEYVRYLRESGIMAGRSETLFAANKPLTRAELAAVTVRALKSKIALSENTLNPFADVSPNAWYCTAVCEASGAEIIKGISETEFAPEDNVTREAAMAILTRMCRALGMNTEVRSLRAVSDSLSDFDEVSEWAREDAAFCIESGYFNGTAVCPREYITRIETAEMLAKMLWTD